MEHNKKKEESHLYTIVKVARDEDLFQQIGRDIYFDLVDHDKVRSFRIHKRVPFSLFKEKVAKEFGVPVQLQHFWLWAKRQNRTYRPHRPMTDQEETQCVGQLKEISSKNNAELKLFLEIKLELDLKPMSQPDRTEEDILLFFKLYDPEKEELRFLGRLFVKSSGKPFEILGILKEKAGLDHDKRIELYEEIKFDPAVMCELIDKNGTFRSSQLENGDIICFQKLLPVRSQQQCRYPDVPSFLESGHNSQVVHFRLLEKPNEDHFCLKLSKILAYADVTKRVACHLGLDDPTRIRITLHDFYTQKPKTEPLKYKGVDRLSDMLHHDNQTSDILFYEVVDIPLPTLQGLRTMKVAFHHATKDEVVIHSIRLSKQSTVGDFINDLKTKVELSHPHVELRLLAVFGHEIYKIFPLNEKIANIDDQCWTLQAEEIPEEEKNLGPRDSLINVYHFTKDESQTQMKVKNFGKPFCLVIHEGETLAKVKLRIQKKLSVPDDEFAKWKFAFLPCGRPQYLQDFDIIYSRLKIRYERGGWKQSLGLEHPNTLSKRASTVNRVVHHMPATRNHKPSRGIKMQSKLSRGNLMEAQPRPVPESDFGNFFNDFVNSTQTRVDMKRNEPVEVLESLSEVPTREYPTAGQLYEGGRHHPNAFDEKFEDIGGFSILKTQASIYKQIWLKYGHIASSQVLTASYIGQVTMVAEIMKTIIEMHQYRLTELSLAMIDSWDEKIKMVEVLKFNVKWFRERFEDVKKDFNGGEKLKTIFVEQKLKAISDAKLELVVAEERVTIAQDKLKMARQKVSGLETSLGPLLSERQIYFDKSKHLLLHGLF